MGPEHGKNALSKNNWDDGHFVFEERLEAYVKIRMRDDEVEDVGVDSRDIFLYGGDIYLESYRYEIKEF